MEIKTILFPTDFSERAQLALKEAIYFSQLAGAHLIIFHVYHHPVGEERYHSLEALEKDIDLNFEALQKAYPALAKVSHSFRRELGISVDTIIETAEKDEIDMIIMATKGARGFGELWGSKTASIVQKVKIPIIVLPNNSSLQNVKTIGLAYDYSKESSSDTLHWLVNASELLKTDVAVITVDMKEDALNEHKKAVKKQVINQLEDIPYSFNYSHHEDVEEGLMSFCHENDIGLISIVPHTYNFIEELFHESLTQKMVFHSDIPLLVIK